MVNEERKQLFQKQRKVILILHVESNHFPNKERNQKKNVFNTSNRIARNDKISKASNQITNDVEQNDL